MGLFLKGLLPRRGNPLELVMGMKKKKRGRSSATVKSIKPGERQEGGSAAKKTHGGRKALQGKARQRRGRPFFQSSLKRPRLESLRCGSFTRGTSSAKGRWGDPLPSHRVLGPSPGKRVMTPFYM